MRYVAVAEVPDSFDHILRLRSDERGELTLGTGGTSKLTRRNRSTSARFSGYSVMFPWGIQGVTIAGMSLWQSKP